MKEAANKDGLPQFVKLGVAIRLVLLTGGTPATSIGTADPTMEWTAPCAKKRPAGGFLDRREVLRLRMDICSPARGLCV